MTAIVNDVSGFDHREELAHHLSERFRESHEFAVTACNNVQLIAIKQLFLLSGGAIALISVPLFGAQAVSEQLTLTITVVAFFLSIGCGLFQLDEDKKYFLRSAVAFRDLHTTFGIYQFTKDDGSVIKVSELLKNAEIFEPGKEVFYKLQIAFFFLAAAIFFVIRPFII